MIRENVTEKSLIYKGLGKKGKKEKVFLILYKNAKITDLKGSKRKNKKNLEIASPSSLLSLGGGEFMIRYGKRNLNINPLVYNEIMKLRRASEREVDQVYIREKKRLARLLLPGESYEDMICLLCKRIGL